MFSTKTFFAGAVVIGTVSTANATLESRLDGKAYYDTELNITWAANANMHGAGNWNYQNAWASNLIIDGVSGWRLPSVDVNGDNIIVNCSGGGVAGCSDNEMGYLYWEEGISGSTPGPFSNIPPINAYWSGTEYSTIPYFAWYFHFNVGATLFDGKIDLLLAWPVHDGDVNVSAIPEPSTYAMLLAGLGVLGLMGYVAEKRLHSLDPACIL
ncbi:PEP-CTERM sorting domain-containing protein [Nitrosomonas sp. sh817]|uniref:PEP-CTERM sorting domain-containing protein n=1 Tax=Nitrosomonas sp. sh817 TaxID=3070658 RepID=UPI0027DC7A5B|nr:PEP-CTERM sorting domain-containing protein [Nitrosomonas sp. sh817]WMJ09847.1 PEP-CTERM sorting domain-containing protein [Nitrosomonas sp. sh817]